MTVPLQAMPPAAVAVLGLIGLALLGLGVREAWRALRYRTRRPVPISELTDRAGGRRRVTVTGVARRGEDTIEAPLTGRECLAYSWRVANLRTMRRLDGRIETWGERGPSGREAVPFVVEDETGRVRVEPEGADLRLAEEWVRDPVDVPDDRADGSSLRDVVEGALGVETHERRYYESRLDEGETVTVRGRVASGDDPLVARRVGVSLAGGVLVADATPGGAAGRALRSAAMSAGAGLFVLVVVALFGVLPLL